MIRYASWIRFVPLTAFALVGSALAQTTTRVSVDSGGGQATLESHFPSISADGRYVAFHSMASNLVPGDSNGTGDVFIHDRQSGTIERISVDSNGTEANGPSYYPSLSGDGRFVAFESTASNLAPGDTNAVTDVFVRDRPSGITELVSPGMGGMPGDGHSSNPSISADGRYVAFVSSATNLVAGDTNNQPDVFVHDRQSGTTERVSVTSGGAQATFGGQYVAISADGRIVAFWSISSDLVPGDTGGSGDIFVRDLQTGTTEMVSISSSGMQGNGENYFPISISGDGRLVAFKSTSSNLVPGDTNGTWDIFMRDRQSGSTELVSVASSGVQGDGVSQFPSMSTDGRYVAFESVAANLVVGDTNGLMDIFLRDRLAGTTERLSIGSSGIQGDLQSTYPAISVNGRYVAFESTASNLVPSDTNDVSDIFLRDRGAFVITAFCFGDGTAIPCPCDNTGQPGHGCNNSISNGGASLAGTGEALLSADTLVLTASQERPTAFSLYWQGGSEIAPRLFGDGIGCMGSPLKRMYGHNAVAGVVAAPQGADLSVSARSAALGNPIIPGTIRVYHVFYRDPDPTFCPTPFGSTFNTTNGLRVLWGQ